MRTPPSVFVLGLAVLSLAAGCTDAGETPAAGVSDANEYYQGVGQYLFHSTLNGQTSVNINHSEIEGFMDAMAMPYFVKDPALVEGLEQGQDIEFRIVVEDGGFYFVDRITPVGAGEEQSPPDSPQS